MAAAVGCCLYRAGNRDSIETHFFTFGILKVNPFNVGTGFVIFQSIAFTRAFTVQGCFFFSGGQTWRGVFGINRYGVFGGGCVIDGGTFVGGSDGVYGGLDGGGRYGGLDGGLYGGLDLYGGLLGTLGTL